MKIALVAQRTPWPVPPADTFAADQAAHVVGLGRALAAQGHQVVIYGRLESATLPAKLNLGRRLSAELIPAGPAGPVTADEQPKYARDISAHLAGRWARNVPDIVHAHYWTSGMAALFAARETGVPVVQTFGSLATAERRNRVPGLATHARIRLEAGIARSAAGILAASTAEADELTRLGIRGSNVMVVPSGVDLGSFRAGKTARPAGEQRLLHLGSLAEDQGLQTVLRALAQLPDAELVIAGGPAQDELDSDTGYRVLAKLAAGLGVTHRVRFTGRVSDDELPDLLRSASVLVSAARYEALGLRAARAMACGVPVVAAATGGYADAVIDGTTGLLIPPGRPDLMVERLRGLLGSPMRLCALGIAAADRARSRYPWDRIANETVAAYRRCLSRPAASPVASPAASPAASAPGDQPEPSRSAA